jgi:hypothetical protein
LLRGKYIRHKATEFAKLQETAIGGGSSGTLAASTPPAIIAGDVTPLLYHLGLPLPTTPRCGRSTSPTVSIDWIPAVGAIAADTEEHTMPGSPVTYEVGSVEHAIVAATDLPVTSMLAAGASAAEVKVLCFRL